MNTPPIHPILGSYMRLAASDELVAKTLNIPEVARIARMEVRVRELLLAKWQARSKVAVSQAKKAALAGRSASQIAKIVDNIMKGWAKDVLPTFLAEFEQVYRLARKAGHKKATKQTKASLQFDTPNFTEEIEEETKKAKKKKIPKIVFDSTDDAVIESLKEHQTFWVGEHYEANVSGNIAKTTREAIVEAGKDRIAAGALVAKALTKELGFVRTPGGFNGTSTQYFEGLVANAATVGRVHGQLRSFATIGTTTYRITNPLDERTCPVCNHMDGKVFTTTQGLQQVEEELNAKSPDAVKAAHPWHTPKQLKEISPTPNRIKGPEGDRDSQKLAGAGFSLPPFHFRCIAEGQRVEGLFEGGSKAFYAGRVVELCTIAGRTLTVTPSHPILTANGLVPAGDLLEGYKLACDGAEFRNEFLRSRANCSESQGSALIEDVFGSFLERGGSSFVTAALSCFHGDALHFQGKAEVVGAYQTLSQRTLDDFSFEKLCFGSSAYMNAILYRAAKKHAPSEACFARELLERGSGFVVLDELIKIRYRDFRGHVYDLQSESGLFFAQGIGISNCRCTVDVTEEAESFENLAPIEFPQPRKSSR